MSELNPKALKYDLAPKINGKLIEHAAAIRALGKKTVENIVEIGRRLTECRSIHKEDNSWRVWLDGELRLSPQTAGRFIQVHELSQTRSNLEHLDLPVSAIYLLAAPSTPEAAKTEIIERAKAGEALPVAKVKRVVDNHKKTKARRQPAKKAKKRAKKIDRQVEEVPPRRLRSSNSVTRPRHGFAHLWAASLSLAMTLVPPASPRPSACVPATKS